MKRTIITLILGTLIIFIWNAVSWMALPFHANSMNSIPESALNTNQLKEQLTEDGVYHYPGMPQDQSDEALKEVEAKLAEGPRITLMVYKSGSTAFMDPMNFLWDLIFNLIIVVLVLGLVRGLADHSFKNILRATISIGLVISFMTDIPMKNWFMFPLDYTLANVLDYLISMTLLGLLFAGYTFRPARGETRE
ncbi:MAG: hypothetical protein ACR2MM_11080 [Flavobacteriaceae bacterium]